MQGWYKVTYSFQMVVEQGPRDDTRFLEYVRTYNIDHQGPTAWFDVGESYISSRGHYNEIEYYQGETYTYQFFNDGYWPFVGVYPRGYYANNQPYPTITHTEYWTKFAKITDVVVDPAFVPSVTEGGTISFSWSPDAVIATSGTVYHVAFAWFYGEVSILDADGNGYDDRGEHDNPDDPPPDKPPLFDESGNVVDFNSISPADYSGAFDNALGGDDTITLPKDGSGLLTWGLLGGVFTGGAGDDVIHGSSSLADMTNPILRGGADDDVIFGGKGGDEISGDDGTDQLFGSASNTDDRISDALTGQGEPVRRHLRRALAGRSPILDPEVRRDSRRRALHLGREDHLGDRTRFPGHNGRGQARPAGHRAAARAFEVRRLDARTRERCGLLAAPEDSDSAAGAGR